MNDNSFKYLCFQFTLMSISIGLPLIMLDAPFWLTLTIMFIVSSPLIVLSPSYTKILVWAYDIAKPILYIWALVVTICGKQDFLAIAFYILFALQIFYILRRFIGTILIIIYYILEKKN